MIKDAIISKRYADAFLAYAKETIGLQGGLDELHSARRIVNDNPELGNFLASREFTNTEKHNAIDAVFTDGFSEETRILIKLLVDRKHSELIGDIAEYARINYAHQGELDALLKTSYPLDTELLGRLKSALESKLEKRLHLYVELDSSLIGGVSVTIGNIVVDGSVRKRLEDLRDKLKVMKVA